MRSSTACYGPLTALWKELGFAGAFRRVLRPRRRFDAEKLLRVMVFNRLCDPESKLGISRWLEGTLVPDVSVESVTHQRLLRTMDTLTDCAAALDKATATLLRPLIDQELSIVFYDLTTIRTEGASQVDGELRHYGKAKEGDIARQVMLGVVQTAEGLPIYHEVFAGNSAETHTLVPTIERVLSRFPIRRVVLVADHGSPYSPERALEIARRIQHHKVTLHQRQSASGVTTLSPDSRSFFTVSAYRRPPYTPCSDKIGYLGSTKTIGYAKKCRTRTTRVALG